MELIINLIIIIVIVASILKRLKSVASKAEELETPPPVAPPDVPEVMKRMRDVFPEKPTAPAVPQEKEEQPAVFTEDLFEREQPEFQVPVIEEVVQAAEEILRRAPLRKVTIPEEEPKLRIKLSFSGPEVVKGIVMSEILSPPVSLR